MSVRCLRCDTGGVAGEHKGDLAVVCPDCERVLIRNPPIPF